MEETLESLTGITLDQLAEALQNDEKMKQIVAIIARKDEVEDRKLNGDFIIENNYEFNKMLEPQDSSKNKLKFKDIGIFNLFESEIEAFKMSRKINAELKLHHIAKHLNKGWTPDWNDTDQEKWKLGYSYGLKDYALLGRTIVVDDGNAVYFRSKEMLPDIISLMGERSLKDYFMIEA